MPKDELFNINNLGMKVTALSSRCNAAFKGEMTAAVSDLMAAIRTYTSTNGVVRGQHSDLCERIKHLHEQVQTVNNDRDAARAGISNHMQPSWL